MRFETLGELIKKAVKESGLKESFIADKMGISRQYLNQVELKKNYDIEFLKKLKDASGIDFTHLINPVISNTPQKNTEPLINLQKNISMSLNINLSSDQNSFENLSDFIITIKEEAKKRGFTIT